MRIRNKIANKKLPYASWVSKQQKSKNCAPSFYMTIFMPISYFAKKFCRLSSTLSLLVIFLIIRLYKIIFSGAELDSLFLCKSIPGKSRRKYRYKWLGKIPIHDDKNFWK